MPIIRKLGRVGHSFQISMPPEVKQHLGIEKGDYIVWVIDRDSRVVVEKLTPKKHPGFFIPGSGWLRRKK